MQPSLFGAVLGGLVLSLVAVLLAVCGEFRGDVGTVAPDLAAAWHDLVPRFVRRAVRPAVGGALLPGLRCPGHAGRHRRARRTRRPPLRRAGRRRGRRRRRDAGPARAAAQPRRVGAGLDRRPRLRHRAGLLHHLDHVRPGAAAAGAGARRPARPRAAAVLAMARRARAGRRRCGRRLAQPARRVAPVHVADQGRDLGRGLRAVRGRAHAGGGAGGGARRARPGSAPWAPTPGRSAGPCSASCCSARPWWSAPRTCARGGADVAADGPCGRRCRAGGHGGSDRHRGPGRHGGLSGAGRAHRGGRRSCRSARPGTSPSPQRCWLRPDSPGRS